MLVGYARVSTLDQNQNLDLQRDALTKAGCERLFQDKKSGKVGTKRPEFEAALACLRPTDVLVVWKLDRLGRSLREVLNTAHELKAQGIKVQSLTEKLDTKSANGCLMFNILSTLAEYSLDLNRERTMAGLKAAVARGRKGGRPRKLSDADLAAGEALLAAGTIPAAEIAKRLGGGQRTFYEYFPQAGTRNQEPYA